MGIQLFLKQQMEEKREQMIQSAFSSGFTSQETVKHSQELDQLMNLYRYFIIDQYSGDLTKAYFAS